MLDLTIPILFYFLHPYLDFPNKQDKMAQMAMTVMCVVSAKMAFNTIVLCHTDSVYIIDDTDGLNNLNGDDCRASNMNDTATFVCGTPDSVNIIDGQKGYTGKQGDDGVGCTVDKVDGDATVVCGANQDTSAIISDGVDGAA